MNRRRFVEAMAMSAGGLLVPEWMLTRGRSMISLAGIELHTAAEIGLYARSAKSRAIGQILLDTAKTVRGLGNATFPMKDLLKAIEIDAGRIRINKIRATPAERFTAK